MKFPPMSRSKLAAASILVGCALQLLSSVINDRRSARYDYSRSDRVEVAGDERQRFLLVPDDDPNPAPAGDGDRFGQASIQLHDGLTLRLYAPGTKALPAPDPPPGGDEAADARSRIYNFSGEARSVERGVTWYNVLSAPRFRWNMAPYRWDACPRGERMYLGDLSFAFHEPDPNDPSRIKRSKHLRFRVQKNDERDCLWNYSRTCLGGGNFLMTFGKTAKEIVNPGDYSLKTLDGGRVRIVAYNTNKHCAIRFHGRAPDIPEWTEDREKAPMDYVYQAGSHRVNPEGCAAWIAEREVNYDLFRFNSDMATVHVDTPWMQITIQLRQNKVTAPGRCVHASLNVWITNLDPAFLGDDVTGVLGKPRAVRLSQYPQFALPSSVSSIRRVRSLSYVEAESHEVDGPFD